LTLVARNNRELATETTGPEGTALIPPAILSGTGGNEPLYLRAVREDGSEFTFLSLADSAFDLSDRGVAGREPAGAVDAYVFTERGIYRPGETVHAVALARRPDGTAWSDSPLTFRVLRPDGNEVRRDTVNDAGAGGHAIDIETSPSAMRSEEHTSELQSRENLVCRLLLEKKKENKMHVDFSYYSSFYSHTNNTYASAQPNDTKLRAHSMHTHTPKLGIGHHQTHAPCNHDI